MDESSYQAKREITVSLMNFLKFDMRGPQFENKCDMKRLLEYDPYNIFKDFCIYNKVASNKALDLSTSGS